jgi:hypothetical protein
LGDESIALCDEASIEFGGLRRPQNLPIMWENMGL